VTVGAVSASRNWSGRKKCPCRQRAHGLRGEVLVTRPVVDAAGAHVEFDPIGEVRLKGFSYVTELFLAHAADE